MTAQARKFDHLWSAAALVPIGLVSLGYVLFKREFAKLHVLFSWWPVPIFVGEWLLAWCTLLLVVRLCIRRPALRPMHAVVVVYFLWVLAKAAWGYAVWGPLALRHAVLFYYPFFCVTGYVFYDRALFSKWPRRFLFAMILGVFLWCRFDHYWTMTLFALAAVLVLKEGDVIWKRTLWVLLFVSVPYLYLFKIARMMFVANVASLIVLLCGVLSFLSMKSVQKICLTVVFVAWIFGMYHICFIEGKSGRIFPTWGMLIETFNNMNQTVQEKEGTFKPVALKAQLYHPLDRDEPQFNRFLSVEVNSSGIECAKGQVAGSRNMSSAMSRVKLNEEQSLQNPAYIQSVSVNNAVFRLFIWRDMIEEWMTYRPVWGFDFGRPLRSKSLEILDWAESEWGRDGWIEPHNSYLNILYRAGIVGIFLLGTIVAGVVYLTRLVFIRRSWPLLFLAAIVFNWLTAANFLLILEAPYTAIPFWTIVGLTLAYARQEGPVKKEGYET